MLLLRVEAFLKEYPLRTRLISDDLPARFPEIRFLQSMGLFRVGG
jgi:hypothetical protein